MGLLTKEQLLKKEELEIKKVVLDEEYGDFVYVREMTGRERDQYEQSLMSAGKDEDGNPVVNQTLEDFRAKLAVNVICDKEGNLLLEPKDYKMLSANMSAYKLDKIATVAQNMNNITKKDREDLVKNLKSGPTDDSTSDSAKS